MKNFLIKKAILIKDNIFNIFKGDYPFSSALLYCYLAGRIFILLLAAVFVWGQWLSPEKTFFIFLNIFLIYTVCLWVILINCAKKSQSKTNIIITRILVFIEFFLLAYISSL